MGTLAASLKLVASNANTSTAADDEEEEVDREVRVVTLLWPLFVDLKLKPLLLLYSVHSFTFHFSTRLSTISNRYERG